MGSPLFGFFCLLGWQSMPRQFYQALMPIENYDKVNGTVSLNLWVNR